jgi:phage baseplate assembly protein gpV
VDIGLAVFASKDCSNVKTGTTEPQQPASFRGNSQANGFYIGGFLNQAPSVSIELTQGGAVNIVAPGGVNIAGNVTVSGDVVSSGISLVNHIHTGDSGGTTSPPIG